MRFCDKDRTRTTGAPRDHRAHERGASRAIGHCRTAAPKDRCAKIWMEISILDDRVSAEEVELSEKKEGDEGALMRTKVDGVRGVGCCREWRHSEGSIGVPKSQSSKAEVGHSDVSEGGVNWKGAWEDQIHVYSADASQKKRKAAVRKESAEKPCDLSRHGG